MADVIVRGLLLVLLVFSLEGCDYVKAIADIFASKDPGDVTNGIDFKQKDLPPYVESVTGFSFPQTFGRWTEGGKAIITFKDVLPSDITLRFYVHEAFGPNMKKFSKIIVGGEEMLIKPNDVDLMYTFPLKGLKNVKTIEIIPAQPAKPSEISPPPGQPPSGDGRSLGIMFSKISIHKGVDD